jgi:hypothetical protein
MVEYSQKVDFFLYGTKNKLFGKKTGFLSNFVVFGLIFMQNLTYFGWV